MNLSKLYGLLLRTRQHNQFSIYLRDLLKPTLSNGNMRLLCQKTGNICWNCNGALNDTFFCPKCSVLREPYRANYFALFGLKENKFNVNATELTKKFRTLQRDIHPDKFSQKSQTEQSHSLDWSSLINKAYKTMMVPLARAEYILLENNIELPQDNSSLDQEFLIEMMERNEAVDEANTKSDIDELLADVKVDIDEITGELDDALSKENFELAKSLVVRMKYMLSIKNSIFEKAEKLGISVAN